MTKLTPEQLKRIEDECVHETRMEMEKLGKGALAKGLRKILKLMEAKRDKIPDNPVQLNATKEWLALYGAYPPKEVKQEIDLKQPLIVEIVKFAKDKSAK